MKDAVGVLKNYVCLSDVSLAYWCCAEWRSLRCDVVSCEHVMDSPSHSQCVGRTRRTDKTRRRTTTSHPTALQCHTTDDNYYGLAAWRSG